MSDLIGPKSKFNIILLATSQALIIRFVLSFGTVFPHSPQVDSAVLADICLSSSWLLVSGWAALACRQCPCHQVLSCHGTGSAAERSSGPWKCYGHCCLPHCDPPYSGEVGRQVVALPQLGDLAQGKPMAVARSGCASHHGQQGP